MIGQRNAVIKNTMAGQIRLVYLMSWCAYYRRSLDFYHYTLDGGYWVVRRDRRGRMKIPVVSSASMSNLVSVDADAGGDSLL